MCEDAGPVSDEVLRIPPVVPTAANEPRIGNDAGD
jgi:hypothetical protein